MFVVVPISEPVRPVLGRRQLPDGGIAGRARLPHGQFVEVDDHGEPIYGVPYGYPAFFGGGFGGAPHGSTLIQEREQLQDHERRMAKLASDERISKYSIRHRKTHRYTS